ncbi:MAG TPA: NAD(P)/FAD-dependent oxidoreductase [Puia sp.]|nr:NAD(P)/FAD-dependent oxidoreductase [Puia sp.]
MMQKPDFKAYYHTIVIGAGVGGLTAAAILSKAGFSVCVLEKEPHAGGYLAGFRRKDFLFDTAIHWLNQCAPGKMVFKLFDILGKDYPAAKPQTRIRRYKGENFDYLLTNNPDEFRDQLIAEFPHEEKGITKFFRVAKRLGKSFNNFTAVFRSEESMSFWEKLKNKKRLLDFGIPFIPYLQYTGEKGLKRGLNKFFKDERLHKIFASETEILSCLVPIGWAYYGDFQSPPKGGSQSIPQWLEHVIRFYKNDIWYKCKVKEILLHGNTCEGVKFEYRGNEYSVKSKYVIAASDIETLYEKMLPSYAVPEKLKTKLKEADIYSSSITIALALDCPTECLGFDEELIHLVDEHESFDAYSNGEPATSEISILPPSVRDKSLAPAGCGTLTIYMPAYIDFKNYWLTEKDKEGNYIRNEEYRRLKKEIAEAVIKRVEEKIAPGLRSHILFYEVATPVTHWRYTGNKNGTMMGAKPGRKNMQNKIAHYQTPVKNLLLGGHWAELGGGVPIASKAGANAALLIFKKENKSLFNALASYMDGKISLKELLMNKYFKPYDNSWVMPLTPAEKHDAKMTFSNEENNMD